LAFLFSKFIFCMHHFTSSSSIEENLMSKWQDKTTHFLYQQTTGSSSFVFPYLSFFLSLHFCLSFLQNFNFYFLCFPIFPSFLTFATNLIFYISFWHPELFYASMFFCLFLCQHYLGFFLYDTARKIESEINLPESFQTGLL
jgi:hypothetical protein